MIIVVVALHDRFFQCAVHAFDLAISPRMIDLGKPLIDLVFMACAVEDVSECPLVFFAVGELDAVIGIVASDTLI